MIFGGCRAYYLVQSLKMATLGPQNCILELSHTPRHILICAVFLNQMHARVDKEQICTVAPKLALFGNLITAKEISSIHLFLRNSGIKLGICACNPLQKFAFIVLNQLILRFQALSAP